MAEFSPEQFAAHYTAFRVRERVLLTGHSHQAWPDCARDGLLEYFDDAARYIDDKWERAMAKAERVRQGFARLMNDTTGKLQLFANTHDAIVRLLSALPYRTRPQIITTSGEFHSLRRQLARLQEEGVEIITVDVEPRATLTARMAERVTNRTLAVFCSVVMFETSAIVPELRVLAQVGAQHDVPVVIDAYHALNVVPFDIAALELTECFVVGGGYKYCQLGEGNCFLRYPAGREFRPVFTGWFAEYDRLATPVRGARVGYHPDAPFAGATYDPISHYRAARVFDFFAAQHLDVPRLRAINQAHTAHLLDGFAALQLPAHLIAAPALPRTDIGGFVSFVTPHAAALHAALRARNVWTDYRGDYLRFGPAPYITPQQIDEALAALGDGASNVSKG